MKSFIVCLENSCLNWKKEHFLNVATHFSIYRMSNEYLFFFSFFLPQGCWMIIHRGAVL